MAEKLSPQRQAEVDHAREVDTEVARLWGLFWEVQNEVIKYLNWAEDAKKRAAKWEHQGPQWARRVEELKAEEVKYTADAEALMPEADTRRKAAQAYDAANYGGWTRFYLVQHIHNTTNCSSFRPTTRIGWLPDVSGLTEVEAVETHGETLCTKCFPNAPVALTTKPMDDSTCPGSGQHYNKEHLTGRERAHFSPAGHCPECDQWVGLTARFSTKIRKHKKPGVK